jgi:iron(III) transport system ATP-binding protein
MRFEIKEIQRKTGITVVYVTHDQTEAMAMSDRIFLISRGVVQQSGTPREIYNHPVSPFVADFLGKVDFFRGEAGSGKIIFPAMAGQAVSYDGSITGKAIAAIRPENLYLSEDGPLSGTLEKLYYLGDVNDCRIRIGDTLVRVTVPGYLLDTLQTGQAVRLQIRNLMVFPDDGQLEQDLSIRT